MDLVGAALRADVHDRAHRVAHSGVECRGLHLEFDDGSLGRRECHAHVDAVRERVGYPVDGEFVAIDAVAVGGKLRGGVVEGRFAQTHVGAVASAGRQQRELHGIAGKQRQFEDAALIHNLAQGGFGGGKQRRLRRDFHLFGDGAHCHFDVQRDRIAHAHLNVVAHEFLEPGGFRSNVIEAGRQEGQRVVARIVRPGAGSHARRDVGSPDFGRGHGSTAAIEHAAHDGAARVLSPGQELGHGQYRYQKKGQLPVHGILRLQLYPEEKS